MKEIKLVYKQVFNREIYDQDPTHIIEMTETERALLKKNMHIIEKQEIQVEDKQIFSRIFKIL